jgi:hypothetical protein
VLLPGRPARRTARSGPDLPSRSTSRTRETGQVAEERVRLRIRARRLAVDVVAPDDHPPALPRVTQLRDPGVQPRVAAAPVDLRRRVRLPVREHRGDQRALRPPRGLSQPFRRLRSDPVDRRAVRRERVPRLGGERLVGERVQHIRQRPARPERSPRASAPGSPRRTPTHEREATGSRAARSSLTASSSRAPIASSSTAAASKSSRSTAAENSESSARKRSASASSSDLTAPPARPTTPRHALARSACLRVTSDPRSRR